MEAIKEAYALRYKEELIDHIEDETAGIYQFMLLRLARARREEEEEIDKEQAAKDAKSISALMEVKGKVFYFPR